MEMNDTRVILLKDISDYGFFFFFTTIKNKKMNYIINNNFKIL